MSEDMMNRLNKTANEAVKGPAVQQQPQGNPTYTTPHVRINEIMEQLQYEDPEYLRSALEQEGLLEYAVENGMFRDMDRSEGGIFGGFTGSALGALGGSNLGGLRGAGIGGLGGAALGGGAGYLYGKHREENPSKTHLTFHPEDAPENREGAGSVSHNAAGEDKSASEMLDRLEKTANEGRQDRSFLTDFVGAGPLVYPLKKNNLAGINEEDSHAMANLKGGAAVGAGLGGALGAMRGKAFGTPGAMGGATSGALSGAVSGSIMPAALGTLHDAWDKKHPQEGDGDEMKEANEMLNRLEKTANAWTRGADAVRGAYGNVQDQAGRAAAGVQDAYGNVVDNVQGAYGSARNNVQGVINDGQQRYQNMSEAVQDQYNTLTGRSAQQANDNLAMQGFNAGADEQTIRQLQEQAVQAGYTRDAARQQAMALGGAGVAGAGAGAGATTLVNGGEQEKESAELMDRLEKSANAFSAGAKALKGGATKTKDKITTKGKEIADNEKDLSKAKESFKKNPSASKAYDKGEAQMKANKTRAQAGGAAAGVAGAGAAAGYAANDRDKESSELMERLEKTANPVSKVVNKAKDLTGKNEAQAQQAIGRYWSDPNQANLNVSDFQKNIEGLTEKADAASAAKQKARGQAKTVGAGAGVGAAGAGAGYAANEQTKDDNQEKQSSENEEFMNGLYKEAAATIIQESVPETKEYIDPIDRISFSK